MQYVAIATTQCPHQFFFNNSNDTMSIAILSAAEENNDWADVLYVSCYTVSPYNMFIASS